MVELGHDSYALEWITNLLSVNIAAYHASLHPIYQARRQFRAAHWAETDGGMHTLEIMGLHKMSAVQGGVNDHYFSHPVIKNYTWEASLVEEHLDAHRPFPLLFMPYLPLLSPEETRQYYLLALAMDRRRSFDDDRRQQSMDDWSHGLFKRYLLAAGSLPADAVESTTLRQTRAAMRHFVMKLSSYGLRRLESTKARRGDTPTSELDTDLVRILAWDYSPFLIHIWRRSSSSNPSLVFQQQDRTINNVFLSSS